MNKNSNTIESNYTEFLSRAKDLLGRDVLFETTRNKIKALSHLVNPNIFTGVIKDMMLFPILVDTGEVNEDGVVSLKYSFTTLDEMIRSDIYQRYFEDYFNIQNLLIQGEDELVDRIIEHNKEGMFGLMHDEVIEAQERFLESLSIFVEGENDISIETYNFIKAELKALREYHTNNGTINEII